VMVQPLFTQNFSTVSARLFRTLFSGEVFTVILMVLVQHVLWGECFAARVAMVILQRPHAG